jgi:hypothetical protein
MRTFCRCLHVWRPSGSLADTWMDYAVLLVARSRSGLAAGRVLRDVRLAPALAVLTITIMLIVMISVRLGR